MQYRIVGLDPEQFTPLFRVSDTELARRGVRRMLVTEKPGFPCRVTLEDAEPGETVLLLNYEHQPVRSPYRSSHAIFVREGADERRNAVGSLPGALRSRELSLRSYDADGMMLDADLAQGDAIEPLIARLFEDPNASYIHAHNAKRGCFAARIERVEEQP